MASDLHRSSGSSTSTIDENVDKITETVLKNTIITNNNKSITLIIIKVLHKKVFFVLPKKTDHFEINKMVVLSFTSATFSTLKIYYKNGAMRITRFLFQHG